MIRRRYYVALIILMTVAGCDEGTGDDLGVDAASGDAGAATEGGFLSCIAREVNATAETVKAHERELAQACERNSKLQEMLDLLRLQVEGEGEGGEGLAAAENKMLRALDASISAAMRKRDELERLRRDGTGGAG